MIRLACRDCGSLTPIDPRRELGHPHLCEHCVQHRAAVADHPLFDKTTESAEPKSRPKRKPPARRARHPAEGGPDPRAKE